MYIRKLLYNVPITYNLWILKEEIAFKLNILPVTSDEEFAFVRKLKDVLKFKSRDCITSKAKPCSYCYL